MVWITKTIKTKQKDIKDVPYFDSRKHQRISQLRNAGLDFIDLRDLHDTGIFEIVFSKDFFKQDVKTFARYFDELITGKKLKEAQKRLHKEEMLYLAAKRMYELTGEQPGAKSGIVKNKKIVDDKSAKIAQSIKIAAAMALTYGTDDAQKKAIMLDIERKYPELIADIKSLVKKAKARIKQDEFKYVTAGMIMGKGRRESVQKNSKTR